MILRRLMSITITATDTIMALVDIWLDTLAAIGEASALPMISPATASQWLVPLSMVIKVSELISAIKNLDSFTVPSEKRGLRPPAISDDRTIEPQPPPPTASSQR